ncbi:MAG: helicase-related protein [Pseudomonadota bacterium]
MQIIDNINVLLGDELKKDIKRGQRLRIAASSFSIFAFEALRKELQQIDELQFLFTERTFTAERATDGKTRERREFFIPKAKRVAGLTGSEFEIQLRNQLTQRAVARECADWIRKKAHFKSNASSSPMQQFLSADGAAGAVAYMPLSGFTAVDLGYARGNAVSNFVNRFDEAAHTQSYIQLFDTIWSDPTRVEDVTDAICEHIASVYQENSPERIYFIMLYNIFHAFLEDIDEDVLPNDRTGYQESLVWQKLFNYQRDAATGIINKLETYNGCILADSVGLGKTFTALAVIKYYELRNRSVLVLCPKKLTDNWLNYSTNLKTNPFAWDRFNYDVLCHTDLSRTSGTSNGIPLNRVNWGNYDLVVIDESHNFRNNDAFKEKETRYQKLMNQVIRAGVKTKVLMLSATPVNNRFNDLRNQLALAYEGQSDTLSEKLNTTASVEEIFRRAQAAFNRWSKLPPEQRTAETILTELDFDFFELLDSVTIARSRKHITTFYDMTDIGHFPERRKPLSFRPPLTELPGTMDLNTIVAQLTLLKLSVYAPTSYILPSRLAKYEALYDTDVSSGGGKLRQADRDKSLQALMTVNLLKRLESSIHAFRLTLGSLAENIRKTLDVVDSYRSGAGAGAVVDYADDIEALEAEDDELEGLGSFRVGGKIRIDLSDMDVPGFAHDLQADLALIEALQGDMAKITPEHDGKLQHLKALIAQKLAEPINPGNRKLIIFTAFADTAQYLYDQIAAEALSQQLIHTGRVTGSDAPKSTLGKGYDFQTLLTLFSPRSKEKAVIMPDEPGEIDILIATDCISEGQNLQDCDFLVNYDIHWNPVRIIQRFGRIDRIGSPNAQIQLANYWPDITLDDYIKLKERVENRMIIADVTATGDDNVLTAKASDTAYRREQLRRLQDEVIELEDVRTGISITDLGLNDFRMDLLNYVKEHGDLASAAKGLHAVVPADTAKGLEPGIIFALKAVGGDASANRQNRLHPYYLIYMGEDGSVVADQTQVKRLLDLVRTAAKGVTAPVPQAFGPFNQRTTDGQNMSGPSGLLNGAIRAMIDAKEERDLDSLFSTGTTTALSHAIRGLEDFELIAFVVVEQAEAGGPA